MTVITEERPAHSRLGASKAHRWMACPGSVTATDGIEETPSEYAEEGTAAHNLLEQWLRDPPGVSLFQEEEPDGEMEAAVRVAYDHVLDRMSEIDDDELYPDGEVRVMIEQQFDLAPLNPPEPMYGTTDVALWYEPTRHLEVIDYKHGQGVVVDAVGNVQLRYYALGAVLEVGKRPNTIRVTIVQPRAYHPDGPIRSEDLTWDELVQFKTQLMDAARATQAPDAPRVPGSHCRFCLAAARCPARMELANEVVRGVFEPVPEVEPLPAPGRLTDAELAFVLEHMQDIRNWFSAIEGEVTDRLLLTGSFPGWKLVEGRTQRRWVDETETDRYLRGRGLKVSERFVRKLVSPAQAERLLKDRPGPELPERLWTKPEGGRKLAPESDKRPALREAAANVFGVVPEINEEEE